MRAQVANARELADTCTYRLIAVDATNHSAQDTAYSNPRFHAVLRKAIKGRGNVFSVHDVAFVDFLCFAHLSNINLQRCGSSQLNIYYDERLALARSNIGKHVGQKIDGPRGEASMIEIVEETVAAAAAPPVASRYAV